MAAYLNGKLKIKGNLTKAILLKKVVDYIKNTDHQPPKHDRNNQGMLI